MESPLVSIIIPTYNYAKFIAETLKCILQQSYTNWEAIIIDDGSEDNTQTVVENFTDDCRFIYVFQKNKGLPAARNSGVKLAKGKYIHFLDADDLISEEKLLLQVKYMEANPNIAISYTNARYFKHGDTTTTYANMRMTNSAWIPKLNAEGLTILENLIQRNIMPVNAALIKQEVFNLIGMQNEELKSLEDWEFWLRSAFANLFFSYLEDKRAFALIRIHSSSMSQNKVTMRNQELIFREKIDEFLIASQLINDPLKNKLKLINEDKKLNSYRRLFIIYGFLDKRIITEVYKKHGPIKLIKIYIKALNDLRKQNKSFKTNR